jgi:hypothetical protein
VHDDNTTLSAADLLDLNRDLQGSRAIRLLATTNLGLYATLMERHLSDGAVPETELVVRLERDLDDLDDAQSGLALIKSWASQGWLHRIVDGRAGHDQNVCYLTQDARRALDFLRGMRRQDTIATGGSITGIASSLKQVAGARTRDEVADFGHFRWLLDRGYAREDERDSLAEWLDSKPPRIQLHIRPGIQLVKEWPYDDVLAPSRRREFVAEVHSAIDRVLSALG